MESGTLARFEEITRCAAEVQDALISLLSEKRLSVPELATEVPAAKGFSIIATANTRDRGVNDMSAALKRRFNMIVLPTPGHPGNRDRHRPQARPRAGGQPRTQGEVPDRGGRRAGRHDLPRAARRPDARRQEQAQGAVRRAFHGRGDLGARQRHGAGRQLRHRRGHAARPGRRAARRGRQGRGEGQGRLAGIPVQRPEETRRGVAAAVHRLLGAQLREQPPGKSTSSASATCRRRGPGTCASSSTSVRPKVVLIEGLADADELIPHITRKGTQAADRHPRLHRFRAGADAGLPAGPLQPGIPGAAAGRTSTTSASSSSTCRRTSSSAEDLEAERLAPARRESRRGAEGGADRRRRETCGGPSAASRSTNKSPSAAARPITTPTGNAASSTTWRTTATAWPPSNSARPCATRKTRRCGGPRTWCAKRTCAAASKKSSPSGVKPEQIVAVVGAFHAPVLDGDFPAMTDAELASLRRRSSKLTLMPYSYFKLSTQSGYGAGNQAPAYFELLWDALEAGDLHDLPLRYLSQRRPPSARAGHASLHGRGDRGRPAGPNAVGPARWPGPDAARPARRRRHADRPRRAVHGQRGAGPRRRRHRHRRAAQGRQPDVDPGRLRARAGPPQAGEISHRRSSRN